MKVHACPHCSSDFSTKKGLTRHLKTAKKCFGIRSKAKDEYDTAILRTELANIKHRLEMVEQRPAQQLVVTQVNNQINNFNMYPIDLENISRSIRDASNDIIMDPHKIVGYLMDGELNSAVRYADVSRQVLEYYVQGFKAIVRDVTGKGLTDRIFVREDHDGKVFVDIRADIMSEEIKKRRDSGDITLDYYYLLDMRISGWKDQWKKACIGSGSLHAGVRRELCIRTQPKLARQLC